MRLASLKMTSRVGVSDAHGHQDVAVPVLGVGVFGAHLAGELAAGQRAMADAKDQNSRRSEN